MALTESDYGYTGLSIIYTVVCICESLEDLEAAYAALDETHDGILQPPDDTNRYTLGRSSFGNTVILYEPYRRHHDVPWEVFVTFPWIELQLNIRSGDLAPISPPYFLAANRYLTPGYSCIDPDWRLTPTYPLTCYQIPSALPEGFKRKYDKQDSEQTNKTPKEWIVSGSVGKIAVDACPDTGSCINAISLDFAREQGWPVRSRPNLPRVKLPGNRSIRPLGVITLPWRFARESGVYNLDFYILRKCVYPVILGRNFLISSRSFRYWTFFSRFKEREVEIRKRRRLCSLGSIGDNRTRGALNGRGAWALADTGSDVMIVSRSFARSLQFEINTGDSHREWLEFADGSRRRTDGVVTNAEWSFGNDTRKYRDDFFVLDGIGTDIILSSGFLLKNRIFSTHELFESEDTISQAPTVEFLDLNLIKRLGNRLSHLPPPVLSDDPSVWTNDDEQEHVRRANAEDLISRLSEDLRESAWIEEHKRRAEWDERKAFSRTSTPALLPHSHSQSTAKARRKFRIMFWGRGRQRT
ncbi:hypothetical protein BJX66DRAFT_342886 [Aspergillus keveii]|uniref:Peptidase A1 domain-containing protein n=1 Tax=Aspergillus keveii TaxID=714993 RepID=A0ABR4FQV4_9EURO